MVTPQNTCSICHEWFRAPEFAARCQAQGRPPILYPPGAVLLKKTAADHLLVATGYRVHHGFGKCPVDGPCEHAVTYLGTRLYPRDFGLERVWLASLASSTWQSIMPRHEHIATSTWLDAPWGVISESGPPELYLTGPHPEEDWRRLWDLWDALSPKKRGRPKKGRQLQLAR